MNMIITIVIIGIISIIVINLIKKNEANSAAIQLKDDGFVISKKIDFSTFKEIYIDDTNKKIAIRDGTAIFYFNYSDIIDFELNEDGNSIAGGKMLSTAVGALAFGIPGAIIGASGNKKNQSTCSSLIVRIFIKNLERPQIRIDFIEQETKKDGIIYKANIDRAKELMATLTYIQDSMKTQ